jgi:hypothetical protein
MSSITYSRPGTPSSASEVLQAVMKELGELRARYKEVTTRIRVLRSAIDSLRELRRLSMDESLEPAWSLSARLCNESYGPRDVGARRMIARKEEPSRSENPELQRACRIALMETTSAVCDDEIYARILRRGSFRFASAESAAQAIAHELTVMADQGEVRIVSHPSKRLWRRRSPDHVQRNLE